MAMDSGVAKTINNGQMDMGKKKIVVAKASKTHWGLALDTHHDSEVTREADPDDEWSSADIRNDVTVMGLRLCGAGGSDVEVCFEPVVGERLHVLVVRYGTGDSFHREDGLMTPVAAFRSMDLALLARAQLESTGTKESSVGIFDEDGSVKIVYIHWSGYFESFESASIETFAVQEAR
jgi:hypothetical protein